VLIRVADGVISGCDAGDGGGIGEAPGIDIVLNDGIAAGEGGAVALARRQLIQRPAADRHATHGIG